MGFVGFFVKLIFIRINNIIVVWHFQVDESLAVSAKEGQDLPSRSTVTGTVMLISVLDICFFRAS
ncbi:hypothetical protein EV1_022995 [Malus domestica]